MERPTASSRTAAGPPAEVSGERAAISPQARPRLTLAQWAATGWIAGVAVFALLALAKAWRTHRWVLRRRRPAGPELLSELAELAGRLGLKAAPKVWLVDGIGQPFVWGLLRGSIHLPGDFGETAPPEDRRAVLAHELAHVFRWDAAVNALQVLAQAVFFFHPLVWWANRKIRREREKCCDETAIATLAVPPRQYGAAIVDTHAAERDADEPLPSLAVAGPAGNVEERIRTIMTRNRKFHRRPAWPAILSALLLGVLAVPTALVLTARAEGGGEEPTDQAVKLAPRKFAAVLSNGVTVELLALWNETSPGKQQWWRPDGTPMSDKDATPYKANARYDKPRRDDFRLEYGYVYRLGPGDDVSTDTHVAKGCVLRHQFPDKDGIGSAIVVSDPLAREQGFPDTAEIKIAAAHGPWNSLPCQLRSGQIEDFQSLEEDGSAIIVSGPRRDPYQPDKVFVVDATFNARDLDLRIRYQLKDGNIRKAWSNGRTGESLLTGTQTGKTMIHETFRVPAVPDNLKQIIVDYRRFEGVTFKSVAARLGVETKVTAERIRKEADAIPGDGEAHREGTSMPTTPGGTFVVKEGAGIGEVVVGATVRQVLDALGPPDKRTEDGHPWLQYRRTLGIDIIFPGGKAKEIRFHPGFLYPLARGPRIAAPMAEVLRVYGTPLKTAKAARDEDLSADRVLYELPSAWKIAYRRQGVL
ncbi:MAG TPA: M56 family metallopeptidase, partial [Phycisphaerae bacterium]|nr:M56 family metallopeptidase [Phycisphaerae bacterium]